MYFLSLVHIFICFSLFALGCPFFFSSFLHASLSLFFPFSVALLFHCIVLEEKKKKMQSSLLSPFLRSIGFPYLLRCLKKKKQFKLQEEKNVVEGFPAVPQGRLSVEMELLLLHEVPLSLFFFLILLLPLRRSETLYCRREFASRALFVFLAETCP